MERNATHADDRPRHGGLWRLVAGPVAWALHFLASYVTAAVWCARAAPAAPLGGARTALFAYTAIALAVIAWLGWQAWRRHRAGGQPPPHDEPTVGDRHRFLGQATALLCGLSFVAVVYTTLGAVMLGELPVMAAGMRRQAWLAAGVLVLAAAWLGPLPAWSQRSFAAHMLMHMSVVALAAPLLAVGLAGSRADPARRWPMAFGAVTASIVEFLVVWAWHAPALHHAARASTALLVLEQASFLAVGLGLWLAAFGGDPLHRRERAAAGIGGLLLTSMHMTLLGVLLSVAARPLFAHAHAGAAPLPFGLSTLQDQHLGGVLMLGIGGAAYLAGALWLLAGLLRVRGGTVADG